MATLAKRTQVIADEELDKLFPDYYASILEIETADGTVHRRRQDVARGYPEAPMSEAELEDIRLNAREYLELWHRDYRE